MGARRRKITDDREAIRDLMRLPAVGPSIARDLLALGFRRVDQLRDADPERMYARICRHKKTVIDRCVLYTFRCAVYAARTARPDPAKLLWWNWKDRQLNARRRRRHRMA